LLSLGEAFVVDAEACFAARALGVNETGALKNEQVLGYALPRDREFGGERTRRRFAPLEQQVEQPESHRIAERPPQAIGVLAVDRHGTLRELVTRAA
jgi:hypothetical protein